MVDATLPEQTSDVRGGPNSPVLIMDRVRKVFTGRREPVCALDGTSFVLQPGEFLSVVGPSGCGKSTLLKIISGLVKPTGGHVQLGDRRNPSPGPDRAFVFQNDALLPWRTVGDNIALGLQLNKMPKPDAQARVNLLIKSVGLEGFANRYPHELSGGMRQRVNLARGLAVDPPVLLMDEPFAALDVQTRELMQVELLRIWQETNKSVIFITHGIDEAVFLSDRVLAMSARPGTICAEFVIDLPRPRPPEMRYTDEFTAYTREIWDRLRDEVMLSFERHDE